MANRYWVGGTANWDGTAGTKWSSISGGAGGDSVPTTADDVFFDGGSGTGVCTISVGNTGAKSITISSYGGTVTGTAAITVAGNVTLQGGTWTYTGTMTISAACTFTSAGEPLRSITKTTAATTITLADAMTLSSSSTFTLTAGTLDLNGKTLTAGAFSSNNTNTRSITFGTSNITVTGSGTAWTTATTTGFSISGTPVVNVTNSGSTATTVNPGSQTEANSISFNFTAGTYALSLGTSNVLHLDFTGFSGTLNNAARTIYGNLKFSTGMTVTDGPNTLTFGSTSATVRTITSNGKTLGYNVNFNGVGGTWRLEDAAAGSVLRSMTLTNGTLNLNGNTFTCPGGTGSFTIAAGTKNITFNGGSLICSSGLFTNSNPTNFTTTAGTGTGEIRMSATTNSFAGGGSTYNCTLSFSGTTTTITGSNTFTTISNLVSPTTLRFAAGTTTTLTNWSVSGTAGNNVTVTSPTAAQHTLSKSSGTVNANYLTLSYSNATGGATWNALNSIDSGNNVGWIITAAPPSAASTNFLIMF